MTDKAKDIHRAVPEPLFKLELGGNGGTLAPTSIEMLLNWARHEQESWRWLANIGFASHVQKLHEGYTILSQAVNDATQAHQYWASNPGHAKGLVENVRLHLSEAFIARQLPHTSTPLAKRIQSLQEASGAQAASAFAGVMTEPVNSSVSFQPTNLAALRGAVEGILERHLLPASSAKARKAAGEKSFDELRGRAELLVGEKTLMLDALHRQFESLADTIETTSDAQTQDFSNAQTGRAEEFSRLTDEHTKSMLALQKAFREEMALRAPAEYWRTKQTGHRKWAVVAGTLSFVGIAGAATWLGLQIHDVLNATKPGEVPPTWRIALLALIGVFSVWALRLLVRMFLSHLHLLSDAGERVVMVQTYLSLLEGGQLVGTEDRHLILQALFRPASDGIVKDEGVPLSIAELLTKTGK